MLSARFSLLSLGTVAKALRPSVATMATVSIDPSMPKRPGNGYNLFTAERIPVEHKKHPNGKITDTFRSVVAQWNKLGDGAKKPYNDKAAKLKAEYEATITDVQRALLAVEAKKRKEDRVAVKAKTYRLQLAGELGRPKRLPNAFSLFMQEKIGTLSAVQRKTAGGSMKVLGAMWRELPDSHKTPYENRAAKNAIKSRQALDTWKQAMVRSGHQDDLAVIMGKK